MENMLNYRKKKGKYYHHILKITCLVQMFII